MPTQRDGDAFARGPLFRTQEAFSSKPLGTSQLKPRFDAVPPQANQAHYENENPAKRGMKGLLMMLCFQVY